MNVAASSNGRYTNISSQFEEAFHEIEVGCKNLNLYASHWLFTVHLQVGLYEEEMFALEQ